MAIWLEDFFQGDTVRVRAVYPAGTDLTGYIHYLVLKANDSDAEPALYVESTFGDHTADLEYAAATPASPGVPATPEVLPTAYVEAAPEVTDMISSGKYLYRFKAIAPNGEEKTLIPKPVDYKDKIFVAPKLATET